MVVDVADNGCIIKSMTNELLNKGNKTMKMTAQVQIVFATCYPENLPSSNNSDVKTVEADNIEMLLEKTFMLQGNNLEGSKYWGDEYYSLSVGDTVWVSIDGEDISKDTLWIVCPMGFAKMTVFGSDSQALKWEQTKREDRYWMARDIYKANVEPQIV